MSDFRRTIEIPAPPERVWSVMRDVERWHEWTASVTRVILLDPGPLGIGSRARIHQPRLPPATWTVTALEEGRGFTWVTRSPGVRVTARHTVEGHGRGTLATLSIRFDGLLGPLVARLTRGLNERYLTLEAEGLRARSTRG